MIAPPVPKVTDKTSVITDVTPDIAREWLGYNINNRPFRQTNLRKIIHVIESGQWQLGNDSICFDTDGNLINGQHRLVAVVETGKTLEFNVLTGLAPISQMSMDTNLVRNAAQQLAMLGVTNSTPKVALVRMLVLFLDDSGPLSRGDNSYLSINDIVEYVRADDMIDEAVAMAAHLGGYIHGMKTAAVALACYKIGDAWPEKARVFHEMLAQGANLEAKSPILQLRNFLTSRPKQSNAVDRRKLLGTWFKAFNLWIEGETREILVFRDGESWPIPYTEASYAKKLAARERGRRTPLIQKLMEEKASNEQAG